MPAHGRPRTAARGCGEIGEPVRRWPRRPVTALPHDDARTAIAAPIRRRASPRTDGAPCRVAERPGWQVAGVRPPRRSDDGTRPGRMARLVAERPGWQVAGVRPTSVYVHFPWCLAKCPYCDFASASIRRPEVPHEAYAGAILRELSTRAAGARRSLPLQRLLRRRHALALGFRLSSGARSAASAPPSPRRRPISRSPSSATRPRSMATKPRACATWA